MNATLQVCEIGADWLSGSAAGKIQEEQAVHRLWGARSPDAPLWLLRIIVQGDRMSEVIDRNNGNRNAGAPRDKERPLEESASRADVRWVDCDTAIREAVRTILFGVGEDPDREGLVRTPERVAKMYGELLEGYQQDLDAVINGALFDASYNQGEMVVVADIDYASMCEHHLLPFSGKAHVAYIPGEKVVGLSKIPRIVDMFARRLQMQERLTNEIADALSQALEPAGVMVLLEGQHSCASLRGVEKHGVNMITTARRGAFRENDALRDEFYRQIGK